MESEDGGGSPCTWGKVLSVQLQRSAGVFLPLTKVGEGRRELGLYTQILAAGLYLGFLSFRHWEG